MDLLLEQLLASPKISANVGKAEASQKQLLTQTHLHLYHFKLDCQTIYFT